MAVDFSSLAGHLLAQAPVLVPQWLPAGKRSGHEWVVGGLGGDAGTSLSINLNTGLWMDFATGDKGGDLISLYAAIHSLKQIEAAKELGAEDGFVRAAPTPPPRKLRVIDQPLQPPPPDAGEPPPHFRHGPHAHLWAYRASDGSLLFWVARYETDGEDGQRAKQYSPWSWIGGKWQAKGYPRPRPLYGLERLSQASPKRRVMLVEGEKACDALAPLLASSHVVMTWPGGAKALATADFSPIAGRRVDLWPDADQPGRDSVATLGAILHGMGCDVRFIVPDGQPDGWDAADAIAEGWDRDAIVAWIGREGGKYLVPFTLPAEPVEQATAAPPSDVAPATPVPRAPEPPSVRDERTLWQSLGLETNVGNGVPPANEDTVDRVLSHPTHAGRFWFDTFLQRPMTNLPAGWTAMDTIDQPRSITDADFSSLTVYLQRSLRLHKMSAGRARAGLELYVFKNQRNCAQEWLNGLTWDGVDRIGSMLTVAFGAEDSDYTMAVSQNFLIGMVARVLSPGCQVDYMPILEGAQGNGKSSALRALGGDFFTESTEGVETKDFLQNLRGKMLVEIGELHQFNKADVAKIKQVITNRVDTYRASYGRTAGDYPRQCVFAGTTNRDDWNADDTGARRFWRVRTGNIDVAWVTANRTQLFAEAVTRYKAGEAYWRVPDLEAKRLQNDAREREIWHDAIAQFIRTREFVTPAEVLVDSALAIQAGNHTREMNRRVCAVLRLEGWVKTTQWLNGKARNAWRLSRIENGPEDSAPEAVEVTDLEDQWSSD